MSNPPAPGELRHRRSKTTISLNGELDLYTVDQLRRLLYDPACRSHVVVDLTDTTFIDSSTLTELLKFRRWLDRRGSSLTILCPNREIRHIFELTGLDRVLTIEPCPPFKLSVLNGGGTDNLGPHVA
jgi:anti-sigma B factor antagonist